MADYFYFKMKIFFITQHAMPPEFGRKWGMDVLTLGSPLPTLLCGAGPGKFMKIWKNVINYYENCQWHIDTFRSN